MTATYANASRVIAWLWSFPLNADDLEDHVGALEESMFAAFLRRLAFDAHIPDAIQDAQNMTKTARQLHDLRQTAIRLQRVCYRLSQSGWFFRTWTVQEHVMARRSYFAFGDEVIDAKTAFREQYQPTQDSRFTQYERHRRLQGFHWVGWRFICGDSHTVM